jgi:hypothetical protein
MERYLRTGGTRFNALVQVYLNEAHIERTEDGCVVAALASEMSRENGAVLDEARRLVSVLVQLVRTSLPQDVGVVQAEAVTATMVGALQLARTLGGKPGRDFLAQTRKGLIERYDRSSDH